MIEFDTPYATSCQSAIVSVALSCNIFKLFDVEEFRDLEGSLRVIGIDTIR